MTRGYEPIATQWAEFQGWLDDREYERRREQGEKRFREKLRKRGDRAKTIYADLFDLLEDKFEPTQVERDIPGLLASSLRLFKAKHASCHRLLNAFGKGVDRFRREYEVKFPNASLEFLVRMAKEGV